MQSMREFMQAFFDQIWNRDDSDAVERLRDARMRSVGIADGPLDQREYVDFRQRMFRVFEHVHVSVVRCIHEGDEVAVQILVELRRVGQSATHHIRGAAFVRVVDGRVVAGENIFDLLPLFAQLGAPFTPIATDLNTAVALLDA
jgi:ketosteroid isomerase-like protein